jgi:adenine/guanine phosphoribosyltransferase-like PRPP-binding protein
MSKSIEIQVLEKIKRSPRGTLLFVDSFPKIANTKAVNKALERLVKSVEL